MAENTWVVTIEAPQEIGKGGVRFNAHFGLMNDGKKVDEFFLVGLRLQGQLVKLPTFGREFPFPTTYLSSLQAAALAKALRTKLPEIATNLQLKKYPDTAPDEVIVEELMLPKKHYGKIFPDNARWNKFERL